MQRNLALSTKPAVHTTGRSRIRALGIRTVLSTTPPITVMLEDTLERKYYQCAHDATGLFLEGGGSFKRFARIRVQKTITKLLKFPCINLFQFFLSWLVLM